MLPPYSSVDQLVALDPFLGVELDDRPHEHSFLVRAARVDGQRLPDLDRALALVDVAVQREQRLALLDRLAHGGRADRAERATAVEQLEIGVDGRRLIETRLERRAVQVEDRA